MRLGIYVQVPFCQSKCTYCNFHTGVFSNELYSPYVKSVVHEIGDFSRLREKFGISSVPEAVVDTIYVGGGTPSLLDPAGLREILDAIRASFQCRLEEVTLEADPETITPEKTAAWRGAGFNRISMGVQSFHDSELKPAGRMHRRADIFTATRVLRENGFSNISFDLIAGLPYQTSVSWDQSVSELLSLRPKHVSVYLMEIDESSRLGLEVLNEGTRYSASAMPSDDEMAASYDRVCCRLAEAGYVHYEISNWALPGMESRHNRKYWQREAYLGFGAGAHSFNGQQRWANAHDPAGYVSAIQEGRFAVEQLESVTREMALEEELFLGLRQLAGIDLAQIETEYSDQYSSGLRASVEELRAQGLLQKEGKILRLAPDRLAVSNEVFVNLLK
jgi:oxygen-independent coproporphyrinogen-3 oxidase